MPKLASLAYIFCCRQYGSNFNYCDVICPKSTKFIEITAIMSFKVIHGHQYWCQLKARIWLPM